MKAEQIQNISPVVHWLMFWVKMQLNTVIIFIYCYITSSSESNVLSALRVAQCSWNNKSGTLCVFTVSVFVHLCSSCELLHGAQEEC